MTTPFDAYMNDERLFLHAFEHAPIGAALLDDKNSWKKVNAALCRMLGYEEKELLATDFLSLTHPDDMADCLAAQLLLHARKTERIELESRFRKKSGDLVWLRMNATRLALTDGGQLCLIYFQDCTENKVAEMGWIDTVEKLESFLLHTSDAVILFDLDGRIEKVNPAFTTIFGWTQDEVIGKQLPLTPPELLEHALADIRSVAAGTTVSNIGVQQRHKNGSLIELNITISPVRDSQGKVVNLASIGRDISVQKRLWKEARDSEESMRRLVDNTPDPLFMIQGETIVQANEAGARLLGADGSEALSGQSVRRFLTAGNRETVLQSLAGEDRTLVTKGCVLRLARLDGQEFDAEVFGIPAILHGEPVLHILIRDRMEYKATEEWIRMSDKLSMVGQLAAGIAHEIRNPLTSIKGFVQLAQKQTSKPDYFAIMLSEIERIEAITSELLLLAKPSASKTERHDVRELLDHVNTLLVTQSILSNVDILTEYPPAPAWIQADGNQIKQVFLNLIKNAIEAMGQRGEVTVRVTTQDSFIRTDVADQGAGIPPELLKRLGQPFFTTKEKGTGLGLMVSYKIIENHEGRVTVTSSPGEGTVFTVMLPAAPPD